MRDLFRKDTRRFEKYSICFDAILLDYSKNRITDETIPLLINLARQANLKHEIGRMFAGDRINVTEERPVLHVALRNRSRRAIKADGQDVMPKVRAVLAQVRTFSDAVRNGEWRGYTGKAITDIVNIGDEKAVNAFSLEVLPYSIEPGSVMGDR